MKCSKSDKSLKDQLEELDGEEREIARKKADIYRRSLESPKDQKLCDDEMAGYIAEILGTEEHHFIQFPIAIMGIDTNPKPPKQKLKSGRHVGRWVAIRPCADECRGKTFLGLYVGDLPLGASASFNPRSGVLSVFQGPYNPAIFVPELKRIVYGCESWWGVLKGPEDMKQITDADVQSIWYVRALKDLENGDR